MPAHAEVTFTDLTTSGILYIVLQKASVPYAAKQLTVFSKEPSAQFLVRASNKTVVCL